MTTTKLPEVVFILQVKVFFDPKGRDTFLEALKPCYEAVLREEECAYFIVGESVDEPGVFRWTEGWRKGVEWFMGVWFSFFLYFITFLSCLPFLPSYLSSFCFGFGFESEVGFG
jgi:hypothetical protein